MQSAAETPLAVKAEPPKSQSTREVSKKPITQPPKETTVIAKEKSPEYQLQTAAPKPQSTNPKGSQPSSLSQQRTKELDLSQNRSQVEASPQITGRQSFTPELQAQQQDIVVVNIERAHTPKMQLTQNTPFLSESRDMKITSPRTPQDLNAQISILETVVSKRVASEAELRDVHLNMRANINSVFKNLKTQLDIAQKELLDTVNSQQDAFIDDFRFHMSQLEILLSRGRSHLQKSVILSQTHPSSSNQQKKFESGTLTEIGISSIVDSCLRSDS